MTLKCGIVGLPNVGKSTLFKALTKLHIAIENYPFCTIEPNIGLVEVPDPRLEKLGKLVESKKIIPAIVKFVDIAGLVSGANQGEGLGNRFLSHIRETDAIIIVTRCFQNPEIVHVSGTVDPIKDLEVIETELILADLQTTERALLRISKLKNSRDEELVHSVTTLKKCIEHLNRSKPIRMLEVSKEEKLCIEKLSLITSKPVMYVANVGDSKFDSDLLLNKLTCFSNLQNVPVVTICATIESELSELEQCDHIAFSKEMGIVEPGLNRLIRTAFQLLNLQTYFTVGPKEVRSWTIPIGATAQEAAGVIHSDFERGFIRAQTISYNDFIKCHGSYGARESGKMRCEGKDYVVEDGDIMNFLFSV